MPAPALEGNAVVAQSGGPTAVINQSLAGVVEGLRVATCIGTIYGARHGVRGMIENEFLDLTEIPSETLERVASTPSAALGSSRDKPDEEYCARILESLRARNIRYFFYIGGNDSSDTCRIVSDIAHRENYELRCFHVPKTIDNDLVCNDHTPGYASAARYVGLIFMGDQLDNRALPGIKINVVMGRHAGFLTAASALLRHRDSDDGPHLIYVPERPVTPDRFIADVEDVYARLGRCQIAVSEGVSDEQGRPLGAELIGGETDAHGNVQLSGSGALGDAIASSIKKHLASPSGKPPRVRADTLGYAQRCFPVPSPVDQREARDVGLAAVRHALDGMDSGSITINRADTSRYHAHIGCVPLEDVAAKTRHLPDEFIEGDNNVSDEFVRWLEPLVGDVDHPGRI